MLGKAVAEQLITAGHQVVALPRSVDILDRDALLQYQYCGDIDVLLNFVSAYPLFSSTRESKWRQHDQLLTEGVANLCHLAEERGIPHLVQMSSVAVYGESSNAVEPDALQCPSLLSAWENAENLVTASPLNTTVLRLGLVIGATAPHYQALADFAKKQRLPVLGDGRAYVNVVNVDDVVSAVVKVCSQAVMQERTHAPVKTVYNICAESQTYYELAKKLMQHFGSDAKPRKVPKLVVRAAVDRRVYNMLMTSTKVSNQLAKQQLGWQPTDTLP